MTKPIISKVVLYAILIIATIILVIPFLSLFFTSFKTFEDAVGNMSRLWPVKFTFDNYVRVINEQGYLMGLWNSVHISVITTIGTVFSASCVAFAFARFEVREKEAIFSFLLMSVMIPGQVLQISMYALYVKLNWIDTFLPFWIPPFLGGGIMNVFLIRQFFRGIPKTLFEAAELDGANELQMYFVLSMRMSIPILITVGIFTLTGTWNDFMGPLLYLKGNASQKPLALVMYEMYDILKIGDTKQWNIIAAGNVLTMLPIIIMFFCCQKYFIEGISVSGIKQ